MKIINEMGLENFRPWSGAVDTFNTVYNAGMMDELEAILEDMYPEGMTDTQLNDLLWFDDEWIYETLGITEDDDLDENTSHTKNKRTKKVNEAYYTGSIYTDEEIEEAVDEILNNYDLVVTDDEADENGVSVCVTDNTSGINFWFDLWVDSYGDLDGDWNQYIFHTNDFDDAVKSLVQDNTYFFNEVMEKAEDYAFANGFFTYDGETRIVEMG